MIEATVLLADDRSPVGRFKFLAVPRKGEDITVPSHGSPQDIAIYNVEEIGHLALTADDMDPLSTPEVVLYVTEIG